MIDDSQRQLQQVAETLDALLRVRYAGESDRPRRESLVASYLSNEVGKLRPKTVGARTVAETIASAAGIASQDVESIRSRCLFYGCDDLIALLVHKRIRSDAIAREEAVLYVQDRLQRDDFRRIRCFDADRGAAIVTYMWQVINNLLLDFIRVQSKRPAHVEHDQSAPADNDSFQGAVGEAAATIEANLEHSQLHDTLMELMASSEHGKGMQNPLREKLRRHLKLTGKEKVFLKAMFQYDMTINEIRELPGFDMGVNEAYRFYYRIMEQLLDCFKSAGVLDSLRAQVSETAPRVSVKLNGVAAIVPVTRIHLLEYFDRGSTRCRVDEQGGWSEGVIDESFTKLSKRLAAYFTPISATEALADKLLADACAWTQEGVLTIAGADRTFRVGTRQWAALKERFAGKSSR